MSPFVLTIYQDVVEIYHYLLIKEIMEDVINHTLKH